MIKKESGQSLVETALIIPILLILLVGIIDVGRLLYFYSHIHLATQETVRIGGLGRSDTELILFAKQYVNFDKPELLEISITPSEASRVSGEYVTVELRYPFEVITPMIDKLIPGPLKVKADSTIRVE
ncbi:MAG: TadE family protein [Bacillales bacterium]|jgi:hypothetical protein|nr:TadE family protein [Bacillales bacterium]